MFKPSKIKRICGTPFTFNKFNLFSSKIFSGKYNGSDLFRLCLRIRISWKIHIYQYIIYFNLAVHNKCKMAILPFIWTSEVEVYLYLYVCLFPLIIIIVQNLKESEPLCFTGYNLE